MQPPKPGSARGGSMMDDSEFKLLVIDDRIPAPELGSGYPRTFAILTCLSELSVQVTYFPLQSCEPLQPCTERLEQMGIEVLYSDEGGLDFESFFAERHLSFDAVWISRPHNMEQVIYTIKAINDGIKIIYDAEGLFSLRDIRHLELLGYPMPPSYREEMLAEEIVGLMGQADLIIAVSESERKLIQQYIRKPILTLGHIVNVKETTKRFERRKDLLFVGGFLTPDCPNEDSMQYFVREIFPKIRAELDVKLWIVGTNYSDAVWGLSSEDVFVTGRVDEVCSFYNDCKVFVAPTRFESGISLKMLECLSHGLPAVVTPIIAEQLQLDESTVQIGRDADDFARKVIMCLTDERQWSEMRENSLQYIKSNCKKRSYKTKLRNITKLLW